MNSSRNNGFGRYIKHLRQERGYTLQRVADGAGITKSYLFGLENGRYPLPSLPHLRGIARGLEVDEADLLAAAGHLPEMGAYLRAKYDLPEPTAEQVEQFVRFMQDQAQEEGGRDEPSAGTERAA